MVGYCNFCNAICDGQKAGRFVAHARKMEKHLSDCKKVGVEARKEIDRLLKKPAARRSRSESPKSKKPKLSEIAEVSSQASSGTINHFFDATSKDEQVQSSAEVFGGFMQQGGFSGNFFRIDGRMSEATTLSTSSCTLRSRFSSTRSMLPQQKSMEASSALSTVVNTASQVTYIKHNLLLEYKAYFKPTRVEQAVEKIELETEEIGNLFGKRAAFLKVN